MKKNFTSILLCLMLIGTMLLYAGCSSPSPSAGNSGKSTKITLNEVAHSIFYAPMYVSIEEGYFAEEGIDLTLVTGFGVV